MYKLEFRTNTIDMSELIKTYCYRDKFMEFCKTCPEYNSVWSCPPLSIDPMEYLNEYNSSAIIGTKIIYDFDFIEETKKSPEAAKAAYYNISAMVRNALLHVESNRQDIKAIAPGSCHICYPCERVFERSCKHPEKMRYSFDSFGMDLTKIAQDMLATKLLWAKEGLPEYHMLISAFLLKDNGNSISDNLINEFIESMLNKQM